MQQAYRNRRHFHLYYHTFGYANTLVIEMFYVPHKSGQKSFLILLIKLNSRIEYWVQVVQSKIKDYAKNARS